MPHVNSIIARLAACLAVTFALGCVGAVPLMAHTETARHFVMQAEGELFDAATANQAEADAAIAASIAVIRRRLEAMNLSHEIADEGRGRITVKTSGGSSNAIAAALGRRVQLDFRLVDEAARPYDIAAGVAPPGSEILPMAEGTPPVALRLIGGIRGAHIAAAVPAIDQWSSQYFINIEFDEAGARKFAEMTTAHVGQEIAIVLDGEVVSAPRVNEPILGGTMQLSGGFTQQSANELAIMLASGALPVSFKITEIRAPDNE